MVLNECAADTQDRTSDAKKLYEETPVALKSRDATLVTLDVLLSEVFTRLESFAVTQNDTRVCLDKALDVVQRPSGMTDRVLDRYEAMGDDVVGRTQLVLQQSYRLGSTLEQFSENVNNEMREFQETTLNSVQHNSREFSETGQVLCEIFAIDHEMKEAQTELEGVKQTFAAIRPRTVLRRLPQPPTISPQGRRSWRST